MGRKNDNPFERPSVQLMLVVIAVAIFANSSVAFTDDGLPWEVTLTGMVLLMITFGMVYAKKTEIALSIVTIVGCLVPTYFVHNYEVPCKNWELGSKYSLSTTKAGLLEGVWRDAPNASKYDKMLPMGLSVFHLSPLNPGIAITANTSEIYHSGLKLDDPLTGQRTHDYLLLQSPRKVKDKTASVSLLARVHTKFEVWPPDFEDYSFSLQTASNVVAPPTMTGELIKLDKGPAIDHLMKKHHLRPFLLDVYSVEFHFEH